MHRRSTIALLALFLVGTSVRAQAPQSPDGSVLRGRVLTNTDEPLANARVTVSSSDGRAGEVAVTDALGNWSISGLAPGKYLLSAAKAGYVSRSRRRSQGSSAEIDVSAERATESVILRLVRAGTISGTIVDRMAEPLAHVQVAALQRMPLGERHLLQAVRQTMSDDRGQFRLFELPPGEYIIATSTQGAALRESSGTTLVATYYPGVTRVADAQTVAVGSGDELTEITLVPQAVRTFTISGEVRTPCEKVEHTFFFLVEGGPGAFPDFTGRNTTHTADGRFTLSAVLPGHYTLHVRSECGGDRSVVTALPLEVGEADISGLEIQMGPPATVRGRVALLQAPGRQFGLESLKVGAHPGGATAFSLESAYASVAADGTFSFSIGAERFGLVLEGLPEGWFLHSVVSGGRELPAHDIVLSDVGGGFEIRLSNRAARVTGRVVVSGSEEPEDHFVFVFSRDTPPRHDRPQALLDVNALGEFTSGALRPGVYVLAAARADDAAMADEAAFERLRAVGTPITLTEGGIASVSLKAIEWR